jgi:hypothetical protein
MPASGIDPERTASVHPSISPRAEGGVMQGARTPWRWSLIALLVAFATVTLAAGQATTARKRITHDVYDSWRSIQGTKISRDGTWLAYALVPQEGDGEPDASSPT